MDANRLKALCGWSPFATGLSATTDLHAGGVFFCVIYRRRLVFHSDRTVDLEYQVVDNWRPLDDEAESLASNSRRGKLIENSKGYLEIAFPNMTYTGAECDNLPGHLAFQVFGTIENDYAAQHFGESVVFASERM